MRFVLSRPIMPGYYSLTRSEIAPLLPANAGRVMEVGCGSGATLRWLRERWPNAWLAGVEINAQELARASDFLDHSEVCDIDQTLPRIDTASIDLLLCLDVLEHLRDPWSALNRLSRFLKPGAILIASLPNVRHASVLLPLLLNGRWEYQSSGIMDRTHLRFFTKASAITLVGAAGLGVDKVQGMGTEWGKRGFAFNVLTLGFFKDFLTRQYLVRGIKATTTGGQPLA